MDSSFKPFESSPTPSIPFSFFVSLLSEISKIPPKSRPAHSLSSTYPVLQTFQRWIAALHQTFGSNVRGEITVVIFRLLFPEHDVRRKYDMQEPRLAQQLARALGVSKDAGGRGSALSNWKEHDSVGCLGKEVREVMKASATDDNCSGPLTIHQVDSLLDQLASLSSFSHDSVRTGTKEPSDANLSRARILRSLFSSISPLEASFVTQIILKDLRPLLYPVSESHYTAALKQYKSNAIVMLTVHDALKAWDPSYVLLRRWKHLSRFEEALNYSEDCSICVFTPLQIPKTIKGTGCAQALRLFHGTRRVWAETKYDGERAQIHVKIDRSSGSADIKIFSKSKRDSTKDRIAIHPIIRNALGLPGADTSYARNGKTNIERDIIIEAEMVAYSDPLDRVDEFWRIRSLIESTAEGQRGGRINHRSDIDSQCSLLSDASDGGNRHLALVFFDILLLDSDVLTSTPYSTRRKLLESVVLHIPGYSMLSERSPVDLRGSADACQSELRIILARTLSDHQEGLVLKADDGLYIKSSWVKLKKDYIPSLGDCLDLVIVGARWDKDRGRELRVPPSTFTTFYLGLLMNEGIVMKDPDAKPHFEIFFTVSYGLSRDQLEDLNFMIKSADSLDYGQVHKDPKLLTYTCDFFSGLTHPDVILEKDSLLLTEVFGAGFTKAPRSKYYELRFPRMSKVFRRSERSWTDGTTLEEFQRVAREAVGRERPGKDVDDWCKELWGKPVSPSVKHSIRRKEREDLLLADLEYVDKKRKRGSNQEDDIGFMKERAARKMQTSNQLQQFSPRSIQPLGIVTNISPSSEQDEDPFGCDGTLNRAQTMFVAAANNNGTPLPPKLLSPPTTRPRSKLLGTGPDKSLCIAAMTSTPTPLPTNVFHPVVKEQTPVMIPQDSTFIDLAKTKRKRDTEDTGGSSRKKNLLDYKMTTDVKTTSLHIDMTNSPTLERRSVQLLRSGRMTVPASLSPTAMKQIQGRDSKTEDTRSKPVTKPISIIPWIIPPPPPPGASGWLPRRSDVFSGPNNSDKVALYNGSSSFYTNPPRWESTRSLKGSLSDIDAVPPNPISTVENINRTIRTPAGTDESSARCEGGRSFIFEQQPLLFVETAVGRLMATSIVWFARDVDTPAPEYRPSWGQLIPQTNKVTRLEALFIGCGWHMLMNKNFKSKKGIDRGLILVDFEEDGEVGARVKMANIVSKCAQTWEKMAKWKEKEEMKPVWIVDARVLRWDVLGGMRAGDGLDTLKRFVLWKKA